MIKLLMMKKVTPAHDQANILTDFLESFLSKHVVKTNAIEDFRELLEFQKTSHFHSVLENLLNDEKDEQR